MKKCITCKKDKELEDFAREYRALDGRKAQCKKCKKEIDKERYLIKKKERELIF